MSSPNSAPQNALPQPLPDWTGMALAISHIARWKMLRALVSGEPRTILELAEAGGCSYENAQKHLGQMRSAGVVEQGRGRLYSLPKRFLPVPGEPVVDFGYCLLRLDVGK